MNSRDGFVASVIPPSEHNPPAWWFIFRGYRLMVQMEARTVRLPRRTDIEELGLDFLRQQYLGILDGRHCFSAELSKDTEAPAGWSYHGLRQLYGLLPDELFWLAGAAVQIVDWDRTHQFCGRCGAQTRNKFGERAKECMECGLLSYPRIAPAVIVLIEKENQLLLARSHRHPPGLFSVLAGFVEPGESLEAAVRREIREEVSIEVKDIRYFGSQPWPFPNSLMIAFTCQYADGEINVDEDEMAEAGWYTVDELPTIPPKLSIARQLIDWFVDKQAGK